MTKTINSMILDDFEHGVPSLFIDFRKAGDSSRVNFIEVPKEVPYEINTQTNASGEITAFDIINFPAFKRSMDKEEYLPNLGLFNFNEFNELPLKTILKQVNLGD